jgi:hypothetical protein
MALASRQAVPPFLGPACAGSSAPLPRGLVQVSAFKFAGPAVAPQPLRQLSSFSFQVSAFKFDGTSLPASRATLSGSRMRGIFRTSPQRLGSGFRPPPLHRALLFDPTLATFAPVA